MEELENEELNRELCALAVNDIFESWSPETQEQVLAEWNDWVRVVNVVKCLQDPTTSGGISDVNTLRRRHLFAKYVRRVSLQSTC